MGFNYSPNKKFIGIAGGYTQYKPKNQKIQQYRFTGSTVYALLFKPNSFTEYAINLSNFILWKSRFALGLNSRLVPVTSYDYFEPRTIDFSRFLSIPVNYQAGGFVSSDYRKAFAYDINFSYTHFNANTRKNFTLGINPRIRFNDKFSIFSSTSITKIYAEPGYVNKKFNAEPISGLETNDILMGVRNRLIIENSISGKFTFNSVMNVNIRIRHYWDKVRYQSFGRLNEDGYLDRLTYNGFDNIGKAVYDRNVNIFNIDLQYNWRFAPGSDIIFVWKNQILNSDRQYQRDYLSNLSGLFESPQTNSFSVRFLYFLDYLYLFPRKNV
ncbi:MAG: hypothetical protein IPO92_10935 [Saprospiraceae bacterium]|nr:hypothetical protein [Saprospiraceae bacterium]